jgi:uncharacterized protein YfiM (DUF2279 family)
MNAQIRIFLVFLGLGIPFGALRAQSDSVKTLDIPFFQPAESFHEKRVWGIGITGVVAYTGTILALDKVWYSEYPRSSFHLFDDRNEWLDMDKAGHVLTAYTETKWAYEAFRWGGISNRSSAWLGIGTGTLLQASLEVLDGFSDNWGFSLPDMAANTAGCLLFGVQQAAWREQRIVLKVSNSPKKYDNVSLYPQNGIGPASSLKARAEKLYGKTYPQTFFKDYNALIFWVSANPSSFMPSDWKFPKWLNLAVGYSGENVYGAFKNNWVENGQTYSAGEAFPRYKQYYLSLDIDLSRIKTKSKILRTVFRTFNFIKIPSPAVEINSLGKMKFHPFIF